MKHKSVLVTGGLGFIGSNFLPYFLETYQGCFVVNLDKNTYAADLNNVKEIENNERYLYVEGDICDRALIEELFEKHNFDGVIHFAAESHVDNSISNPDAFICVFYF